MTIDWEDIDWTLMRQMAINQNHRFKHQPWYEDVIHDAVVYVLTKPKPDKLGIVTWWLNTVRYLMRHTARKPTRTMCIDDMEEPSEELQEPRLHDVLKQLSPTNRTLLQKLLAGVEGKEIAEMEGVSPQNVSLKRRRLQQRLRELV